MVEKQIKDHSVHLRQLTAKAMTNKADAIKELIDYLILAHASSYVVSPTPIYHCIPFSFTLKCCQWFSLMLTTFCFSFLAMLS